MEYKGAEVKAKLEGKICSYDKSVPDSICAIYLTDMNIFVSEDNYDGTFTDHYVFPISGVADILMEKITKDSDNKDDFLSRETYQTSRAERSITTKLLDSFFPAKYFTIVSKLADGNNTKTHFLLTKGSESKFISEFKKLINKEMD